MALLHPDHWQELSYEFEARKYLLAAEGALMEALDTAPVANGLKSIREALAKLHPATRDDAACEEYEARRAGSYVEPKGRTSGLVGRDERQARTTGTSPVDRDERGRVAETSSSTADKMLQLLQGIGEKVESIGERVAKLEQPKLEQPKGA
jgi:hypothetical protein